MGEHGHGEGPYNLPTELLQRDSHPSKLASANLSLLLQFSLVDMLYKRFRQCGYMYSLEFQQQFQEPCKLDIGINDENFFDSKDDDLFDYDLIRSDFEKDHKVYKEAHGLGRRRHVPIDPNSIKYLFYEETWFQFANEYEPSSLPFCGNAPRVKYTYPRMPTFLHLFGIFWS